MSGKLARRIWLLPVKAYQKFISPLSKGKCIYQPSCSSYLTQAVMEHGIIKGTVLGVSRILRCNRFFMGGPDPVPETFSMKALKDPWIVFRR